MADAWDQFQDASPQGGGDAWAQFKDAPTRPGDPRTLSELMDVYGGAATGVA